ncbi:MAG: sigma-54 dependent transcriptional regulator [bacterium]
MSQPDETVLIVDDEERVLDSLEVTLGEHFRVRRASDGRAALALMESETFAVVLADQRMPVMTGVEFLKEVHARHPDVVRILFTGYTDIESVVAAVNEGHIYYYISKPWDPDDLAARVRRALEARRLRIENRRLYEELAAAHERLKEDYRALRFEVREREEIEGFVGKSSGVREALELALKVAPADVTVLLCGESGTGKERIARAIHAASGRAEGRFVAVNCGAITETLLESELFGYRRGAFTGATSDRKGLFEVASGGTLFLDEVADMSPAMQVKLLRAVQERVIRPVGAVDEIPIDVRLISATHCDLAEEVRDGRFREDLYYRISVFPIFLPPLRERRDDVPLLVALVLSRMQKKLGKRISGIRPVALDLLCHYPFPGNIRELENELERASVLTEPDGWIDVNQLSPRIRMAPTQPTPPIPAANDEAAVLTSLRDARDAFERRLIDRVLAECGGNASRAAERLGLSRMGLQKKLKVLAERAAGRVAPEASGEDD